MKRRVLKKFFLKAEKILNTEVEVRMMSHYHDRSIYHRFMMEGRTTPGEVISYFFDTNYPHNELDEALLVLQ